jgi:MFS transporter, DHA2 family, multidrug resistance protein
VGFATLSIAIGALPVLLDRGELEDWLNSTEIGAEAAVAGIVFYPIVVDTATIGGRSFLNRHLLKTQASVPEQYRCFSSLV